MQEVWIFGYGSLIWDPGFQPAEQVLARASGYRRSFCMRSVHHRGTKDENGLVLALDAIADAVCDGVAFRPQPDQVEDVLAQTRARELISSAYVEVAFPLALADGRNISAIAYVIDPDHVQYCQLDLGEQARIIARAVGGRGPNWEYLYNTAQHLRELGIADPELEDLATAVREIRAGLV